MNCFRKSGGGGLEVELSYQYSSITSIPTIANSKRVN